MYIPDGVYSLGEDLLNELFIEFPMPGHVFKEISPADVFKKHIDPIAFLEEVQHPDYVGMAQSAVDPYLLFYILPVQGVQAPELNLITITTLTATILPVCLIRAL